MAVSDAEVRAWLERNVNATDKAIAEAAKRAGVPIGQLSRVTNLSPEEVSSRASAAGVDLGSPESASKPATVQKTEPLGYSAWYKSTANERPKLGPNYDIFDAKDDYNRYQESLGFAGDYDPYTVSGRADKKQTEDSYMSPRHKEITRIYNSSFGRNPTPEELNTWMTAVTVPYFRLKDEILASSTGGNQQTGAAPSTPSDEEIRSYISSMEQYGGDDRAIAAAMDKYNISAEQVARATGLDTLQVQARYDLAKSSGASALSEPSGEFTVSPVTMQTQPGEAIQGQQLSGIGAIEAMQAGVPPLVSVPERVSAPRVEAERITAEEIGEVEAARGELGPEALVGEIRGEVSQKALAEGITGVPSPEATVKFQMADLMKSIEEGQPLPPWAAPAARAVGAVMQQRGLGASSMASAAMTQAILEAGIPIASQDAQTYAQFELQSLNNRQQAALQNAATYAQMDIANLDARLQAAVTNAKSFLSIDLQNLTNDQRTRELNYQTNAQRMFTNQAAENAARQFNAQTQVQVDMFFSELATQVETSNANRVAAAEQFNVSQVNATRQFNQTIQNQRDQFNSNMSFQVEQSNAEWRRAINTANTAAINRANEFNAANAFQLEYQRQQNLWQEYRDELSWANTSAENAAARDHEITLYALQKAGTLELMDKETEEGVWRRIGEKLVDNFLS